MPARAASGVAFAVAHRVSFSVRRIARVCRGWHEGTCRRPIAQSRSDALLRSRSDDTAPAFVGSRAPKAPMALTRPHHQHGAQPANAFGFSLAADAGIVAPMRSMTRRD